MTSTISEDLLGKIHHGDCIAGMNSLPAGSIDLVFADPPFNIGYDYDVYHDAKDYNEYLAWSRDWIGAVHRVLKPDGTFWLAIGDEYAAELKIESQKIGFHIRSWVIWYYTFGVNCKTKFSRSHAHLFHFVKNSKKFTFRADELENRVPSARLLVYGDSRGNPDGRLPDDTWILRPQNLTGRFTPDDDDTWVLRPQDLAENFSPEEENWYFPRVAGTFKERAGFHGCQMPEQLLGRIIRICSHEREIVLDPFSGSATTLAVAKKLRRRFLGFDLSPEYVRLGSKRLARIKVSDALDGAPEPTMSAPTTNGKSRRTGTRLLTPMERISKANVEYQAEWSKKVFVEGLIEAFQTISDGYSVDRVIADPDLDRAFADACVKLSLPGDIRIWNRQLFRLRKAGKLSHIPTEWRTDLSWEDCDAFLFASEIAWKQMLDRGHKSLDEIFCDPNVAQQFDQLAMAIAPNYSPLHYRWGALKLRKESKRARARAGLLQRHPSRFVEPFLDAIPVLARTLSRVPDRSGIYLVTDRVREQPLYAGESLNLRDRLMRQFKREALKDFWKRRGDDISVQYFTVDGDISLLLAYQSLCVRKRRPELNMINPH